MVLDTFPGLVSFPILGFDFLRHHALLVDIARARVLDADSLDVLSAVSSPAVSDPFCAHMQAPEKSGNSCQSTQTSSLQMAFRPLHLNMEYSTTCPQLPVLQFLQKPAVWNLRS